MKNVVILDYGLGNLFSVLQAFKEIGVNAELTDDPEKLALADAAILPGVGAFGHAMKELESKKIIEPLLAFAKSGKPLLGICLGMQLLMDKSEEFGEHLGLGLIQGSVKKFPMEYNHQKVRVPHMGWSSIHSSIKKHPSMVDVKDGTDVYFVHSYYVELAQPEVNQLTWSEYAGFRYTSSLVNGNIWAYQFHPEKSGKAGLQLYKNWAQHFQL